MINKSLGFAENSDSSGVVSGARIPSPHLMLRLTKRPQSELLKASCQKPTSTALTRGLVSDSLGRRGDKLQQFDATRFGHDTCKEFLLLGWYSINEPSVEN